MTLEELRDDYGVVKDRIGAQLVIPLQRHDETRQIVTGDRVDRSDIAEELTEAVEHSFVFAMGIRLF
jgi:cephalosporin-C deacetylase-like acetyl esterase